MSDAPTSSQPAGDVGSASSEPAGAPTGTTGGTSSASAGTSGSSSGGGAARGGTGSSGGAGAAGGSGASTRAGWDHTLTSSFVVEIDGVAAGYFQEVSGLSVSVETEDIQEGGQNGFVHRLPGRMSWQNVTLKSGLMTDQNALLGWLREASGETFAANGNTLTRKTFAIALKDRTGQTLRTYNFVDAFPVSWSGPSFSLGGEEMPSEELEVTHHGFTVETPSDPNAAGPGPASSSGSSGGAGAPQGAAGSPGGR